MTPFPPEPEATERRNPVPGTSGGVEATQAVSGDLRAALGTVLHNAACSCLGRGTGLMLRESDCDLMADAVLADGWVRVSVDDDTVERVARMIHDHSCDGAEDGTCGQFEQHRKWYISDARFAVAAAVQALRDGGTA